MHFTDLAATSSASWSATQFAGTTTYTTGITAPDGTTGAAQASSTSGSLEQLIFYSGSQTVSVGDYFIGGFWERSTLGSTFLDYGDVNNVSIAGRGNTVSCSRLYPPASSTFEGWAWIWQLCELTAVSTSPATVNLEGFFNSTTTLQVYAPILMHISNGAVSNDEAYKDANNLASYDSSCAVGSLCGLSTQKHQFPELSASLQVCTDGRKNVSTPASGCNLKLSTVSTLPSASTSKRRATVVVTDATTFTVGTCTGGGSDTMVAVSNGTSWTCH